MEKNITFESLPFAVMELTDKVDLIINLLDTNVRKREEIPKYMNTEKVLAYFKKNGFPMSVSRLYKLTSIGKIPVHKSGSKLLFIKEEIDQWSEANIHINAGDKNSVQYFIKTSRNKGYKNNNNGKR